MTHPVGIRLGDPSDSLPAAARARILRRREAPTRRETGRQHSGYTGYGYKNVASQERRVHREDIEAISELTGTALLATGDLVGEMHQGIAQRAFKILGPAATPMRVVH